MGHRSNLVVRRRGEVDVYYSQWGALSLLADLLSGPGAIDEWVKDLRRDRELIDNVFSEGIALADFDDQLLLLRGGLAVRYILPVRRAYLEMLRGGWPEWSIEWAARGVLDVAQRLGLPTAGLDKKPQMACPSDTQLRAHGVGSAFTWVSVVAPTAEDYPFRAEPGELLLVGPRLLEYCAERTPGSLPAEDELGGGMLLDPTARRLGWWSSGELRPSDGDVAVAWPDWQVHELSQGFRDQLAGSGREPSSYLLSPERVKKYIADELFPDVQRDPVDSIRRLEARLKEAGQELIVNPDALKHPRPNRTR